MVALTHCMGMFPLFLRRTADAMAPRLSVVIRRLVRLSSFRPHLLKIADRFP